MVNPDSDLFAEHPDWIYSEPGRTTDTARGQYVLNLTLPAVQEFVAKMLDELLTDNDIAYLRWDANRPCHRSGRAAMSGCATSRRCTRSWRRSSGDIPVCSSRRVPPVGTHRLRCAGSVRRLLDQRQHRRPGPTGDSSGLFVGLPAEGDAGMGHRRAELLVPAVDPVAVPIPQRDVRQSRRRM